MSFEDEWAQLVAGAKEQQAAHMRLNGAGGGGGGGQGKLHVTPAVLRDRADKAVNKAAKEFREAHKDVVSKTSDVGGSLKGFACDGAFGDFSESWKKGAAYVAGQIGEEGLAKALRSAADSFGHADKKREESFQGVRSTYKPGDVI
ncbi:WXG100 family type VII secretion target [Streptomyces sp. UNOC14_S4]|uniref:WXG100 family type VII secretion target n=1 Tax=Streptomyces sp. UNOC14_S4 TaxID=2872340 RepID=UPI001E635C4F|nr:WXG100 family type VII secretion target [Streptomyces sp. UNOC14_S4]MCC3772367.1 WXG100 family type VII secretion target [Streptomyces sp. UNOC14_S4]